jgi:predicted enzyme related to lactoylglutathione lyase
VKLNFAHPIFRVADNALAVEHYTKVLGFRVAWSADDIVICVVRDEVGLFLSQGDQGNPGAWCWISCEDAEALHAELALAGAKIRQPPTNFPWGLELQVEDLDGNVLRIASAKRQGAPFGEWLDMYGKKWKPLGAGD